MLWQRLLEGFDAIGPLPEDRFDQSIFRHPRRAVEGMSYTFEAGSIDGIFDFDPGFFGISVREAEQMDPQQRLLLMLTYEAMQDGAQRMVDWAGSDAAVFIGISSKDYSDLRQTDPALTDPFTMLGSTLSIAANRISYAFDLRGPSMAVDTACSSAIVALHQACHAIWSGQASRAIVGAAQALLSPVPFIGFSKASMLSDYGRCRAFAAEGRGYVRAEGGGVAALKPLSAALADGDPIHAVIRGIGINADGRTRGMALPSAERQAELLRRIYGKFGLDPAMVDYCEAHGTGTAVGDPAEAGSLGAVLGRAPGRTTPLVIGSIKANIGHLEPAAGMAGLVKALCILKHGVVPPTPFADKPNPDIDFDGLGLRLADAALPLTRQDGRPLTIGINSFGFGGANAHAVIEAPPAAPATDMPAAPSSAWPPLIVTGNAEAATREWAGELARQLRTEGEERYRDIAWTAAFRRDHHRIRAVIDGAGLDDTLAGLECLASSATSLPSPIAGHGNLPVAFVFSGNGSQWAGMGRELLRGDAAFRETVRHVDELLSHHVPFSVVDVIEGAEPGSMHDTRVAQAALLAIQLGIVEALAKVGIRPAATAGHSVGEIAAAHVAGALTLEQAVHVIAVRSEAQHRTRGMGRMMAVRLGAEAIAERLAAFDSEIELAAINSPDSVTLSGSEKAIRALDRILEAEGVQHVVLDLDYVFHSRVLDPTRDFLLKGLAGLQPAEPALPLHSTVTGGPVNGCLAFDAGYWWRNVREPVQFDGAIRSIAESGVSGIVEIGPHPILLGYCSEIARRADLPLVAVPTMSRDDAAPGLWSRVRDQAFARGLGVDWTASFPEPGRIAPLPRYPWQAEPYRLPPSAEAEGKFFATREGELLGYRPIVNAAIWHSTIDTDLEPEFADHAVGGTVVFPAAGLIELALEAALAVRPRELVRLDGFEIASPLVLAAGETKALRLQVDDGDGSFRLRARTHGQRENWSEVAMGRIAGGAMQDLNAAAIDPACAARTPDVGRDDHYRLTTMLGLDYGPAFQVISGIWLDGERVLARLQRGASPDERAFAVDPMLLDGAFQAVLELAARNDAGFSRGLYLPVKLRRLTVRPGAVPAFAEIRLLNRSERAIVVDIRLFDEAGAAIGCIAGMRFRRAEGIGRLGTAAPRSYVVSEEPVTIAGSRAVGGASLRDAAAAAATEAVRSARPVDEPLDEVAAAALEDLGTADDAPGGFPVRWRTAAEAHPELTAELLLVAGTYDRLRQADAEPLEPPTGLQPELWTELLEGGAAFAAAHQAIAGALRALVAAWPEGTRLRILELGEGPTALIRRLLPLLPPFGVDYYIWNRHRSVIDQVTAEYADDRRVRPLDIDDAPPPDALPPVDVVIGMQLPFSGLTPGEILAQLENALTPGGIILFVEPTPSLWFEFAASVELGSTHLPGGWQFAELQHDRAALPPFCRDVSIVPAGSVNLFLARRSDTAAEAADLTEPGTRLLLLAGDGGAGDALAKVFPEALRCEREGLGEVLLERGTASEEVAGLHLLLPLAAPRDPAGVGPALRGILETVRAAHQDLARISVLTLGGEGPLGPATAAAATALVRVLANEFPDVELVRVDVDDMAGNEAAIRQSLLEAVAGQELRLSGGRAYATRFAARAALEGGDNLALGFERHSLDKPLWRDAGRRAPGAGEIRIDIAATGLNYRDVMFAQGVLPEDILEGGHAGAAIGLEGAGVVGEVGEGISSFHPGDRVMFFGSPGFAQSITLAATSAVAVPDGLELDVAAGLPTVFMTAHYALGHVARIEPGERVLIHGGAGGVGLAAIQYAQHVGATVFATAGDERKRSLLRLLGVQHVYGSRDFDFVAAILDDTDGEGVDVVLNSIAGEGVHQSLGLLRPFGRFVELGKRDYVANTRLGLAPFRHNISYHGVDLDQLVLERPELAARLFEKTVALFRDGVFRPLPTRVYEADQTSAAFRQLQQSKHIGKLVIRPPRCADGSGKTKAALSLDPAAVYVVTGGTAGFGLEAARWLARKGARRLALVSRRGPAADQEGGIVRPLAEMGVDVRLFAADLADREAVAAAFRGIAAMGPVKGILHAAAAYHDKAARDLTAAEFDAVFAPKALGAWNVLREACVQDLDFVVLFSSISGWIGNPGQANYAAANGFLDGLAAAGRQGGLRVVSVGFGAIDDAGYLTRNAEVKSHLAETAGIAPITAEDALDAMWRMLGGEAAVAAFVDVDWNRLLRMLPGRAAPRFAGLASADGASALSDEDLLATLSSLSEEEAQVFLVGVICEELGRILRIPVERLSGSQSISDIGVDSLMAVELGVSLSERLKLEISPSVLSDNVTIERLAARALRMLTGARAAPASRRHEAQNALLQQHGIDTTAEFLD